MNVTTQELKELGASIIRMLSLVRESSQLAKRSLIDADITATDLCIDNDKVIDEFMDRLEQKILTIIALRQPAATDLRFLAASYRMLSDIERAGDYAVHVSRTGKELASKPRLKKYTDMARILDIINDMIENTIKALANSDAEAARYAHSMDLEIDDLYEQIQRELLTYMMEDPKIISTASKLLSTARYLERLGDHLENVNEHIIFWLTSERM